jgi:8-oxo-dGTP diphosphatase
MTFAGARQERAEFRRYRPHVSEPRIAESQLAPRAAVAVLLVRADGSVLAQHRDSDAPTSPNQWGLVGGAQEDQEEPLTAALRELREETGLIPAEPLTLFYSGVRPASRGSGVTEWHVFFGRTAADDTDIVVGEGRDIRFVPADVLSEADLGVSAAYFVPLFLGSSEYQGCVEMRR